MQPEHASRPAGGSLTEGLRSGEGGADLPVEISAAIREAQEAFRRDLPQLLREARLRRRWVAYRGPERIGVGPSKRELYQECLRRGYRPGEFLVRRIEPEAPREVEDLPDV
jgi:hypothetical protein